MIALLILLFFVGCALIFIGLCVFDNGSVLARIRAASDDQAVGDAPAEPHRCDLCAQLDADDALGVQPLDIAIWAKELENTP